MERVTLGIEDIEAICAQPLSGERNLLYNSNVHPLSQESSDLVSAAYDDVES